ncbi:FBD-like protein [Artemisia annua]|uniref:FBD-like protein n=1 Tax=Artemisia annua TaxID=35608 RepID=A0A2U1LNP6_ARTAN|nr:FBD-like protein [Artemisia annua]
MFVYRSPSLNAFKLIRGCPILESLSLAVSYRWGQSEDYIFNIPTLKHLKLEATGKCVKTINKVVLNVPNLEDLFISGEWCSLFVMEDFPTLVSVKISPFVLWLEHLWVELLKGISGAKLISFMPYFQKAKPENYEESEESHWIDPKSVPTCMLMNLKTMKFEKCMARKDDIQFLEYMLRNAKVLKTLTIMCESGVMEEEFRLCAKLLNCSKASKYCEIHFVAKSLDSATS